MTKINNTVQVSGISNKPLAELIQMAGKRFLARNEGADNNLVIDIFNEIDDWWGYGVNQLAYQLSQPHKDVTVRINSIGGSVTEGIAIRNLLKQHPKDVHTVGVGLAASIASVVLMAGDRVSMADNSFLMIHRPWALTGGDADWMKSMSVTLETMGGELENIYLNKIRKSGKLVNGSEDETLDKIRGWMKDETWFSASQALEIGLIDDVLDGEEFVTEENAGEWMDAVGVFAKVPQALQNKIYSFLNNGKMAKKKLTFFDQMKNLIDEFAGQEDADVEVENQEEGPDEEEENGPTEADLQAARELLESQGLTISEGSEDAEEEEEVEEEAEVVVAKKKVKPANQVTAAQLKAIRNEITRVIKEEEGDEGGLPSGGVGGNKKVFTNKKRAKAFDKLATSIMEKAARG